MNAIPEVVPAHEADPSRQYVCPLCKAQATSDQVDIGWVHCPMLDNAFICFGCCLDYQGVARSDKFEVHPFKDLFDEVSQLTGKDVATLRKICLEHQEEIVSKQLKGSSEEWDGQNRQKIIKFLSQIRKAKDTP